MHFANVPFHPMFRELFIHYKSKQIQSTICNKKNRNIFGYSCFKRFIELSLNEWLQRLVVVQFAEGSGKTQTLGRQEGNHRVKAVGKHIVRFIRWSVIGFSFRIIQA